MKDYKQFAFILISLSIFLFIGIVIPTEDRVVTMQGVMVGGVFLFLLLAFGCHVVSLRAQKQFYEENNSN